MSKISKKSKDVSSRISHEDSKQPEPRSKKLPKEDVATTYAEAVLKSSSSVTANISKTPRGRCMLVTFSGIDDVAITSFVFGQDCIVISAVDTSTDAPLFDTLKRTYGSVETAAKFIRLAFIKGKQKAAKAVPIKPSKAAFANKENNSQVEA